VPLLSSPFLVDCNTSFPIIYSRSAASSQALSCLKTGDDRALALGILIGSIAFAVFAYAMSQMFPQ
jgi:hypothetical protein